MLRRTISARTAPAVLAAGLGLALIAAVAPASAAPDTSGAAAAPRSAAAPAALQAAGPFAAAADVSLLTLAVPSLSPSILPQTNVDLAHSQAHVESDADLDGEKAGAQRTFAEAGTTGTTSVLDAPVELQVNDASAPPSEASGDVLLPLDLEPLLDLPVIRTSALANWVSDTECVAADTPLSLADQALADLTLLGGEAIGGGSVAELNTEDAEGAADAEASTYLAAIDGPGSDQRAVQGRVRTDVTSLNVLNGLAGPGSAISADVVQNPNWIVSASGLPGGAQVTGPDPAVNVSVGGDSIITLVSGNDPVDAQLLDLNLLDLLDLDSDTGFVADLLTDLGLEALVPVVDPVEGAVEDVLLTLSPVARLDIPTVIEEAPDGTRASVTGALLRVQLLAPDAPSTPLDPVVDQVLNAILGALGADTDQPLLSLQVAPYGAEAEAPAGGITCGDSGNPLRELNKHASAAEVAAGGEFDYNISVPNRGPCDLTDVTVTDVVTGPAGFEIIETEPEATVDGSQVSWDIGDLAANETVNLRIRVRVPADAPDGATFDDVVTASGNCDGRPVTEDDRLDDIPVVRRDFTGDCNVQFSNKDASHIQVFRGQTFSYYVHAFNAGGEPCDNVRIVDTLDDRVAFVSCNRSCTNDPANTVTWTLDQLPAGSSAVLSVVVQVEEDASGTLENSAVITPEGHQPVTVRTRGPVIGPDSIPKDPASPSRRPLPRTGSMVPTGLAAGLGLGAAGLFALRRRMTA
jgi:uncharacterized repeat protein (TIGR01451 family)